MRKKWWSSLGRFSQIFLSIAYEKKIFNHPLYILAIHWKLSLEIWQFLLFFSHFWRLKTPKSLNYRIYNFANKKEGRYLLLKKMAKCSIMWTRLLVWKSTTLFSPFCHVRLTSHLLTPLSVKWIIFLDLWHCFSR